MINDNFEEYITSRNNGLTAGEANDVAARLGLDLATRIRMLRSVYGLSLVEAKSVTSSELDMSENEANEFLSVLDEFLD